MFVHKMSNINHKHISREEFKKFFQEWLELEDVLILDTIFRNADFNDSKTVDENEFVNAFMCEHFFK